MARIDELRLMAKVARMYYTRGLNQTQICERLDIHQSTVSRLLKKAEQEGIVRITVSLPSGSHTEVEDALETAYGLQDAIVVDCLEDEDQIARDLGAAAAFYLETTLKPNDVIGISSWSASLLSMVDCLHPNPRSKTEQVVQILGGVGNPNASFHATTLTRRLATLIGATATLLPAPGVVGTAEAKRILLRDPFVSHAIELFDSITLALVGIGSLEPSKALASSGNVFSPKELRTLASRGAVGDICLRFFDESGKPVVTDLDERVISIGLNQLTRARRVVGVAGGKRKTSAIRAAIVGKLLNVLITDLGTAQRLLNDRPEQGKSDAGQKTVPISGKKIRRVS
ncbi:MAG TPA: sugar-binding transcriptional regulator [Bryobacteraceae bacterium]|nr:sugar-binding transcriptional regulator [Bryobacteraceae bacterium]